VFLLPEALDYIFVFLWFACMLAINVVEQPIPRRHHRRITVFLNSVVVIKQLFCLLDSSKGSWNIQFAGAIAIVPSLGMVVC
jgi:hypothetical protein